jgi:hypothetical protein
MIFVKLAAVFNKICLIYFKKIIMQKVIIILICLPILFFGQTPVECVQGDCHNEKSIKRYENRLYEGDFKNGNPDGKGYCKWDGGEYYEGYWKNGDRSGEGTMVYSNVTGVKYTGEWEHGAKSGEGTMVYSSGNKYIGEWSQGDKYGEGIMTYADSYIGFGFKVLDHKKTSKVLTDKIITQVYAGSPAEIAGLLVDDVILTIDKLHYDEWFKANGGSKKIDKKHKLYIKRGKEKAKYLKIRIAKVSKKGSPDLMSYDGEWIKNRFDGIGTAIYYTEDKKIGVWNDSKFIKSLVIEDRIKEMVESEINEWQKKGEFEKTITYQARVMDKNRVLKVKEFEEIALQNLKSEFCESVDWSKIELSMYDSDNEAFIIKGGRYLPNYYNKYYPLGDLVISIPIDTAKYFKENFDSFKFQNLDCVTSNDNFILSYVELHGKDQLKSVWYVDSTFNSLDSTYYLSSKEKRYYEHPIYAYSSADAHDYIFTEIDFVFADIKIDEVEDAMITKKSIISRKNLNVGTSAVNKDIPLKDKLVEYRYALIIGNEDYESKQKGLSVEQNVDYARIDASIFKEYALKTFGVKKENLIFLSDATSVEMKRAIEKITKLLKLNKGNEAELIVYYAGHGQPKEITNAPYLFPVDVNANDFIGAIKLDDIYRQLSATGAKKVIIFLDACFTGGARGDHLMASRGITVEPQEEVLSGNLLIFSASSGMESSLAYEDEEHGMFTYYLLKKLQESEGNVSMGDLADYLKYKVADTSIKVNSKDQMPTIRFSPALEQTWRNWKL